MDSGYLSIVLGLLLSISEILPFIKSIQGNGIINVLHNFISKQREIGSNLLERIQEDMETAPLLQENQSSTLKDLSTNLSKDLMDLSKNLSKDLTNLSDKSNTSDNFSLKTPDEYQLMYIEKCMINDFTKKLEFDDISHNNYKVIESVGFRIDFNPSDETYIVHT
jgi:hypothetical protein